MATITLGLFSDSKKAGTAVSELKQKGYAKEISVLAHDKKYVEGQVHEIKQDVSHGAGTGATVGAITGALVGVFSGISTIVVPGVGVLVGGPLAALLGVTGGTVGSLAGGILGALVDLGINEPAAQLYETHIQKGDVLVGVSTEANTTQEVHAILTKHGVTDLTSLSPSKDEVLYALH